MTRGDFALDMLSPIRHVATELDWARRPLAVEDLAHNYRHSVPSDLYRVRFHHGLDSDCLAIEWLMREAVEMIRDKSGASSISEDEDGRYMLAVPFEDLSIHPADDPWEEYRIALVGRHEFSPDASGVACEVCGHMPHMVATDKCLVTA